MTRHRLRLPLLVGGFAVLLAASPCGAQFGMGGGGGFGGGGFGGGMGGGGMGGGGMGGGRGFAGGVKIDADGVVSAQYATSRARQLATKKARAIAGKFLSGDLNRKTPMRKISLVRLEQACAKLEGGKKRASLDIQFLAGLQRIDYLFVDPERGDVVIAGPAEGFAPDEVGRVLGVTTRRPPLRIDDLIVALRSVAGRGDIGVSIDPVANRLKQARQYLARNSSATSVAAIRRRFQQLAKILGPQTVRTWGIPPDSHFAQTLIDADVQMKYIALGLDNLSIPGLRSHLSLLKPQGNSMQRWWVTPLYEAVYASDDHLAFQLAGQRAQLVAQEELVGSDGQRSNAPLTRVTTRQFARIFTAKFPLLAERSPVFAQLQNLIDLSIVAALMRKERLHEKAGWSMEFFLSTRRAFVAKGETAKQINTIFNTRSVGKRLILGLVSGGVIIQPLRVAQKLPLKVGGKTDLLPRRQLALSVKASPAHPWWWD